MRVTANTSALKNALSQVGKVVQSRPVVPAVGCVLLEAHVDGGLTLSATDTETRAIRALGADVAVEGAVLLPSNMLQSFVGELPSGEVTISVDGQHRATLTAGSATVVLAGMDADHFPPAAEFERVGVDFTLAADVFASGVAAVAHAMRPDEGQPVLAGVNVRVVGGTLTLAAADGYRLATHHIHELPDAPDLNVIVRGKPLAGLSTALSGATSVRLAVNDNASRLLVESEAGTWHLPLIDGAFPDYNRIVPRDAPNVFEVNRADLLAAIKLVSPVATENSNITRLRLDSGVLTVRAAAGNQTAETTVSVEPVRGDGIVWALNNRYLRDALGTLDSTTVTVEVASAASPTMLHSGDRKAGCRIVMAMRERR